MQRYIKVLFWAGLIGLLTACSTAELFYDNADRLLLKQLNAYLGLTNAQQEQVIVLLRERLAYNKQNELPRYHAFLKIGKRRVGKECRSWRSTKQRERNRQSWNES